MADVPDPIHPLLQARFQGRNLTVLSVDGRPAWVARELGAAIGYANGGKRLVSLIGDEWSDEFLAGHDYTFVDGADLAALKGIVDPTVIPARAPSLMLLFEPGVHLVLTKTAKPIGRELRRFLVDEVLPQLVRLHAPVDVDEPAVPRLLMLPEARAWLRELRLARRVDLDDRRFRSGALHGCVRLLHAVGHLDDEDFIEWEIRVAEIALGRTLNALRAVPPTEPSPVEGAMPGTIDDLAALLGVTVERIRRAAAQLGLEWPTKDGPVDVASAVAIEALLITQGFVRPRAA